MDRRVNLQNQTLSEPTDSTICTEKNVPIKTHFKMFYEKQPALEYMNKCKNKSLYLFSQDKYHNSGAKKFFVANWQQVYNMSKYKNAHNYECYEKDEPLKLMLDIDIDTTQLKKNVNRDQLFNNTINVCINVVNEKLASLIDVEPELIVLSCCRQSKLSAHVIYNNIAFRSIDDMKFFMMKMDHLPIVKEGILDMNVYRVGCFRLLFNSKKGKTKPFTFYKGINYEKPNNDYNLFLDTLLRNVEGCHILDYKQPTNLKLKNKKRQIKNYQLKEHSSDHVYTPISVIKMYLDMLDKKRADKYNDWLLVGIIIHNSNPMKGFKLWDNWSKQSEAYCGKNILIYKWNSFKFGSLSMATLKVWAKEDNPELYNEFNYGVDKRKFDSVKFKRNYLLNLGEPIKGCNDTIPLQISMWMTTDIYKTLVFMSPYDTGKTTAIETIIDDFNPKRILFISYRQSLSYDLHYTFKHLKVHNYLDRHFKVDRLICQIESLPKIVRATNYPDNYIPYEEEVEEIPKYDLVICDEIESILQHFDSPTLGDTKRETFQLMCDIIQNSKKLLVLDGDFGNRGYDFVKSLGNNNNFLIFENTIKKGNLNFQFCKSKVMFDDAIESDLKQDKNVALISMSATLAKQYHDRFVEDYNIKMHISKSGDEHKEALKNVAEEWKVDLLIYSPTVEAGVNFNVKHFWKKYMILSANSCSQRALMQMNGRIRMVDDKNIMVLLNGMPYKEKANFYLYDEVRAHMMSMYKKYMKKERVVDKNGVVSYIYKKDLYFEMLVYNELEKLNKKPFYFVPGLIKMLTDKGHTYELLDNVENKEENKPANKTEIVANEILTAKDINYATYEQYMYLKKSNMATAKQKYAMERYEYKVIWKLDGGERKFDFPFLKEWYGKHHVLYRLRALMGYTEEPEITWDNYDIHKIKLKEQLVMLKEMINTLGFSINELKVGGEREISREEFIKNMNKVITKTEMFINVNKSQPLFGYKKYKINQINTSRRFIGFVKTVLKEFGLTINCNRKSVKVKNKMVCQKKYKYQLDYSNNINKYL